MIRTEGIADVLKIILEIDYIIKLIIHQCND
jgi:hypothetical protein